MPSPVVTSPAFAWPVQHSPGGNNTASHIIQPVGQRKGIRRHTLEPLQMPPVRVQAYGPMPLTASIFGSYGEHQFETAIESSPMTSTFQRFDMPYKGYSAAPPMVESPMQANFWTGHDIGSWPSETLSSSLSSDQSSRDYHEQDGFFADPVVAHTLDHLLGNQSIPQMTEDIGPEQTIKEEPCPDFEIVSNEGLVYSDSVKEIAPHYSLELSHSLPSLNIGKTPALRFLINYYDKVISPVIVAFDGPTNPYRNHILQLASENEVLQHAIAALSASNLRMRREHNTTSATQARLSLTDTPHDNSVRKSSIAHTLLNDASQDPSKSPIQPGNHSKEELYHKGESIRALNAQLTDPVRRKDDSTLATLLMLCLYHICDTGIAKFRTQFAGVKKILALRGDCGSDSRETKWLTTMFTWFDAMTATVNDREGQFHLDMPSTAVLDNSTEWALENLAGCDGRLFSTISKLGRLNLLSQGKPVSNLESPNTTPKPKPQPLPRTPDFYSLNYSRFDGNGWSSMPEEEEDIYPANHDPRNQFWTEWYAIRKALEDWRLDVTPSASSTPSSPAEVNRRDLLNISESFRHSALLYTERLAYPHLPSAATNFQTLVTKALTYIQAVKSDVYLLWPLFITGTECVEESHRAVIRERCWEIQKDSGFFNNISGLELLEKIWKNGEQGDVGDGAGFKWRRAMRLADEGEYIVI